MTETQAESKKMTTTFQLHRTYVKDLSFEAPDTLKTLSTPWQPDLHLDMNTKVNRLDEKSFEIVLVLTANVKNSGEAAYIAEVHQAGVFNIEEKDDTKLKRILGCSGPATLFPYGRECIANLVARAGFPSLVLAHMDFEQLYDEALIQMAGKNESGVEH